MSTLRQVASSRGSHQFLKSVRRTKGKFGFQDTAVLRPYSIIEKSMKVNLDKKNPM